MDRSVEAMVRRFLAPIRVEVADSGSPTAFRWRYRRYRVCAVHARWVEATAWWQGSSGSKSQADAVWRVEAVSHADVVGVYDLVQSTAGWRLRRVID